MFDFLTTLLSSDEFMPHGHCYLWRPGVVWLHVISDATIGLAYTTIPFTLFYFVRRRRGLPYHWMFLCFGLFIITCGATHYLEILTLWHPVYWFSGGVKAVTALASLPTAVLLVRLVPHALALPSPEDMRRATDALRASEARFRAAIDAGLDAFFVLEAVRDERGQVIDWNVVEMNTAAAKLLTRPGETTARVPLRSPFAAYPALVAKHLQVLTTGRLLDEELELDLFGEGSTWTHHEVVAVSDGVAITLRNISERKRAEQARLLAAIVESSEDAIMAHGMDGTIESWNPAAERLYGYTASEAIGRHRSFHAPPEHVDELPDRIERLCRGERVDELETVRQHKDGTLLDVSIRLSPVRDDAGAVVGVSGIVRDITASKEADRKLKASLREQEILLKEVHHRVKNNLQVISSLLNLEAGRISNPAAADAFRKSQARVRSIAAFHESVYQSKDLARVDMARYFGDLQRGLGASCGPNGPTSGITIRVDAGGTVLGADLAIPCGLIVNELMTNAFKHAFPQGRGTIDVTLRRGVDRFELQVADDGIGLPSDLDIRTVNSLGLHLVQTLSEQIGGTIHVDRAGPGVAFTISFTAPV